MNRVQILSEIDQLKEQINESTSITDKQQLEKRIHRLGQQLLSMSASKRAKKIDHLKRKGSQLTYSEICWLLDQDLTKKQVAKIVGMGINRFTEYLRSHEGDHMTTKTNPLQSKPKKQMTKEEQTDRLSQLTEFDIELIEELKDQGYTLGEMALQLGMQYQYFCQKRKKHLNEKPNKTKNQPKTQSSQIKEKSKEGVISLKEHQAKIKQVEEQITEAVKKEYEKQLYKSQETISDLLNIKRKHEEEIERLKHDNKKVVHLENLLVMYIESNGLN